MHFLTEFDQIENEYGNIESSYGKGGNEYVKWAARMALSLGAGVPWVMCKQLDAPHNIVMFYNFLQLKKELELVFEYCYLVELVYVQVPLIICTMIHILYISSTDRFMQCILL